MTGTQRAQRDLQAKRIRLDNLYRDTPFSQTLSRQLRRADGRAAKKELLSMEKRAKRKAKRQKPSKDAVTVTLTTENAVNANSALTL